jgi:glycosyltransferase involved in cell wall biosynthesis
VFFDQSVTVDSIPLDGEPDTRIREKFVILGRFTPANHAPPPARQLAARLAKNSNIVITAANAPSPALAPLRFRSRRLWGETIAAVDRITKTPFTAIIYPAGLGFDAIDKPRWRNRRMEEWRRIKLAMTIATRAKECILLPDLNTRQTPLWATLLLTMIIPLLAPRTSRVLWAKDASQSLMKAQTGKLAPRILANTLPENIVHIQGITDGQNGLARNTLMSAEAFALADIPTSMSDAPATRCLTRPLTLHHVNADQIPHQMRKPDRSLHIGFLLWELETLPRSHLQAGKILGEVWVPSRYVQKIYEKVYDCPVVNVGKGISLPELQASDMAEYGINASHHVILMCFDAHSSVERKNPLAAVQAFLLAFPNVPNARLIIKTTSVDPSHWGDPNGQMQQIRTIVRRDPRVIVDERMLPFNDLLALIKRADCVVSPHRAEGFGYIPAYALSYACPVIVTDYSGTQEICSPDTAYPVPYKLVNTGIGETITPIKNAQWAAIDVEALANTMRETGACRRRAQLVGNFFGFFRFEIQRDFHIAGINEQPHHTMIGRADLQIRRNIAFAVNTHNYSPWLRHGYLPQRKYSRKECPPRPLTLATFPEKTSIARNCR